MAHPESLYKQSLREFRKATEDRYRDEKDRLLLDEFLRQRADPTDARDAAESLANDASKKYSSKKLAEGITIPQSWINNILGNINNFVSAGNTLMEGAPESVGLAWFAVKITLSAIQSNYELYNLFGSGLSDISEIMIIVRHYDRLYDERSKPGWKASALVDKLFQDVVASYTAVLEFSFAIKRHLTAGTLTRFKHGFKDLIGTSKNKFESKLGTIAELKKKILEESQGAFQDKTLTQLEGVANVLGDIAGAVNSIQGLQKKQEEWQQESNARLDALLKGVEAIKASTKEKTRWDYALQRYNENQAALKPMKGTDAALGYAIDARHDGTCRWMFEWAVYQQWEDPEAKTSDMFCITGQEGTGKSVMIASVVERLGQNDQAGKFLLYLSCSTAVKTEAGSQAQTYTADSICHTLLSMLYREAAEAKNEALLEACNEVFVNNKAQKDKSQKQTKTAKLIGNLKTVKPENEGPDFADAFARIAVSLKKSVILVVDGVDRTSLSDDDQGLLHERLTELVDDTTQLTLGAGIRFQVLVGCGASSRFFSKLQNGNFIDMADGNAVDIETTLAAALEGVRGLSTAEKEEAKTKIVEKAGFRFDYLTTVAIPFIKEPFQRPLSKRLEALPGGINDTYTNELRKMSPNYVDLLRTALTWSLLQTEGREPRASEILDVFNNAYGNPDDVAPGTEQKPGFQAPSRVEIEQLRGASGPFFELLDSGDDDYSVYVRDRMRIEDFCFSQKEEPKTDEVEKPDCALCARCQGPIAEATTLAISPKEGHLQIALTCLRHINHPLFQRRAGLDAKKPEETSESVAEEKADDTTATENAAPETNQTAPEAADAANTVEGGFPAEVNSPSDKPNDSDTAKVDGPIDLAATAAPAAAAEEEVKPEDDDSGYDTDVSMDDEDQEEEGTQEDEEGEGRDGDFDWSEWWQVRYELQFWPLHMQKAEALWPVEERKTNENWQALMTELDKFTSSEAFYAWQSKYYDRGQWLRKTTARFPPLHVATYLGLESWTTHLLGEGVDPNVPASSRKMTAVQAAALSGNNRIILKLLLEKGGDLNYQEHFQIPAFHLWMIKDCSVETVQLMLDHGADVQLKDAEESKDEAIHYLAIHGTDPKVLDLLVERGAGINAKNSFQTTPLHYLVFRREVPQPLLEAFIAKGADVNADDSNSIRPLQSASLFGELDIVKAIVKADVSEIDDLDHIGDTALAEASIGGHAELAKFLLQAGSNPNIVNRFGETAFLYAARTKKGDGPAACTKVFLEYAADPKSPFELEINLPDKRDHTPFFCACQGRDQATAILLLDALVAKNIPFKEINRPTKSNRTPLRQAADRGYDDVVSKLIALSASDPESLHLNTPDLKKGQTPLHRAAWHGRLSTVKLLLSAVPGPTISLPDTKACTALNLAYSRWSISSDPGYEDIISRLIALDPIAASPDVELIAACAANGSVRLLKQLRRFNADLSRRDQYGWTPLELARDFGHKAAVDFLKLQAAWLGLLPSRWATSFPATTASGAKSILDTGTSIIHTSGERVCVSSDRPLPAGLGQYYFEVTLKDVGEATDHAFRQEKPNPIVAVGFCTIGGGVIQFPGWPPKGVAPTAKSWAYHADDGGFFTSKENGFAISSRSKYGPGDTVGCGVDLSKKEMWWTLNGERLDFTMSNVEGRLFPVVGLCEKVALETNFGTEPFKWKRPDEEEEEEEGEEEEEEEVESGAVGKESGQGEGSTVTLGREKVVAEKEQEASDEGTVV
ncbi:hypothetical protein OQA88_9290 [Cercophora sp. LCS_1]